MPACQPSAIEQKERRKETEERGLVALEPSRPPKLFRLLSPLCVAPLYFWPLRGQKWAWVELNYRPPLSASKTSGMTTIYPFSLP